jgi:hypothetical protein
VAKGEFRRPLPSQRAAERLIEAGEAQAAEEAGRRKEARLLRAFDWLLRQENGRLVWAWLFDRCGYNKPGLLRLPGGDVAALSTECVAAQREIYRELRKKVPPELLAKVEYEAEFGEVKPEEIEKGEKGNG